MSEWIFLSTAQVTAITALAEELKTAIEQFEPLKWQCEPDDVSIISHVISAAERLKTALNNAGFPLDGRRKNVSVAGNHHTSLDALKKVLIRMRGEHEHFYGWIKSAAAGKVPDWSDDIPALKAIIKRLSAAKSGNQKAESDDEGASVTEEKSSKAETANGKPRERIKKTPKWDKEAEDCAKAFIKNYNDGSMQPLMDFCEEYHDTSQTKCSGSTLTKKLMTHRKEWDPQKQYLASGGDRTSTEK